MTKNNIEGWIVFCLITLFCGSAFWVSTTFDKMPPILKRGIQPADFPQIILVFIVILTIAMTWFDPIKVSKGLDKKTLGSFGLIALFSILTIVDLFLALGIFAAALSFFWGEKRWNFLFGIGIIMPTFIFFLFDQVFEIRFPRGVITNLWYG